MILILNKNIYLTKCNATNNLIFLTYAYNFNHYCGIDAFNLIRF